MSKNGQLVSFLVSTMNQKNREIIKTMNIKSHAVVVNQSNITESIKTDNTYVRWIDTNETGLSNSRNMALHNSTTSISVISDDDMVYEDGINEKIVDCFDSYVDADIIVFQVTKNKGKYKNYWKKPKKINWLTAMKISSVEISLRTKNILDSGVLFRPELGAGSEYSMGEENVFLNDCLKKGLKIYYIPINIGDLQDRESSWFKGYTPKYFFNQGAVYAAISKWLSIPLILQYLVRKRSLYKEANLSVFATFKVMREGRRDYLKKYR